MGAQVSAQTFVLITCKSVEASPQPAITMASVMQPLSVAAVPEILHLGAKSSYRRSSMSATTAASSRNVSPSESEDFTDRDQRRCKTVRGSDAVDLNAAYPSGIVAPDSYDDVCLPRSQRSPAFDDNGLANVYPTDLVVRNTFLEFVEQPVFSDHIRRIKSAPASPVAAKGATLVSEVPAVLELASMLSTTPKLGDRDVPTVGSAKHQLGECKPCAFFWKPAGCSNGATCEYCHLCDAREKKRRQKEKKALFKARN